MSRRWWVRTPLLAATVWIWAWWQNRRWSRSVCTPTPGGSHAVVVLGFRNPGPNANLINRWRCDIALRDLRTRQPADCVVVLSGGSTSPGTGSEASKLASYLRQRGFEDDLVLEEGSRTTWENVANTVDLVAGYDTICFVSQPSHALKARIYASRQRPDLACRLVAPPAPRALEHPVLSVLLAVYGQVALRKIDAAGLHTSSSLAANVLTRSGRGSS